MHRVFIALAALLLAGCATAVNGTSQKIAVETDPPGARCELSNESGHWSLSTPGSVSVTRSSSNLVVRCTAPGRAAVTNVFPANAKRPTAYGYGSYPNMIDAPFEAVDLATGANRFYPDTIKIALPPAP